MVIYIKCSVFYAIINHQFNTSELKNVEMYDEHYQAFLVIFKGGDRTF